MQLSRLYSNEKTLFSDITFNSLENSKILNVIFAKVTRPKAKERDSHNLGKTTLVYLIDFAMLRNISGDFTFFLVKHAARFANWVFFLEVAIGSGNFVTIRRSVSEPTKIALKFHSEARQDFRDLSADRWDHWEVALEPAREILDARLNLNAIAPWDFRKGISYFLRSQADYQDFFQIEKFSKGKDRDWKPYLARVYGLDFKAIETKYELDATLAELERRRQEMAADLGTLPRDRGELIASIELLRDEIGSVDEQLDRFDFTQEERRIGKRVIENLERRISEIDNQVYDLNVDIEQVDQSIETGIRFDIDRIKEAFDEAKLTLPDSLVRDYESLIDFNKRLTRERNAALKARSAELKKERDAAEQEQAKLNDERQRLMRIVREADTFRKFKELQGEQAEQRARLAGLEAQLKRLDAISELDQSLRIERARREQTISEIEASLARDNPIRRRVTTNFGRYVKEVLGIEGKFFISQNRQGNVEFEITTQDTSGNETSQGEGKTYKQLLCALLDLAVLKALEDAPFYHFVYHDGIFEGLDNRVKLRLIQLLRTAIAEGKTQYILSVIDTDLPRDPETDEKLYFKDDEIVLTLSDAGDRGRLFKFAPF